MWKERKVQSNGALKLQSSSSVGSHVKSLGHMFVEQVLSFPVLLVRGRNGLQDFFFTFCRAGRQAHSSFRLGWELS